MWEDDEASEYDSGEYRVVEFGRDLRGHHEHTSDGYYYQVIGPGDVDGWAWLGALCFYTVERDNGFDEYEWLELPNEEFQWSYDLGESVITNGECLVQPRLDFMQNPARDFRRLPAGEYTIVDAGVIYDDDAMTERLDGWGYGFEMQPEDPYGIYHLESRAGKRYWTFEQFLKRVIEE